MLYELAEHAHPHGEDVVCVLDEFNRAAADVQEQFMQVFDKGIVQSVRESQPRAAPRFIFVLTSNQVKT